MAQGQIRFGLGLTLAQALISIFGTNKTGMTGAQKKEKVISEIEPFINFGAEVAENSTANPVTKAEIAIGVQALHGAMLAAGLIHDTAALEAGTAAVPLSAPQINVITAIPPPQPLNPPTEQAKYQQWLRLATPGLMPANETLRANLYVAGDALFNDGDVSNAAEFYFVVQGTLPSVVAPNSPTGRTAKPAGRVG